MSETKLPLSGDVLQTINPWTWWIKSMSQSVSQVTGLININNMASADPDKERRIVQDVASYGRQLGRIVDALDVVVGRIEQADDLTGDERIPLQQFSDLVRQIEQVKGDKASARLTLAAIHRLIDDIRALRPEDARGYAQLVDQVHRALPPAEEAGD